MTFSPLGVNYSAMDLLKTLDEGKQDVNWLSDETGIPSSTLYKYLTGLLPCPPDRAALIMQAFPAITYEDMGVVYLERSNAPRRLVNALRVKNGDVPKPLQGEVSA